MICPHCGKKIDPKMIARHFASIGGRKSKRALTSEEAKRMVAIREIHRKDRLAGK
jgi:hypothetical protein